MPNSIINFSYNQPTNIICLGMISWNKKTGSERFEGIPWITAGVDAGYSTNGNVLEISVKTQSGLESYGGQQFYAVLHRI